MNILMKSWKGVTTPKLLMKQLWSGEGWRTFPGPHGQKTCQGYRRNLPYSLPTGSVWTQKLSWRESHRLWKILYLSVPIFASTASLEDLPVRESTSPHLPEYVVLRPWVLESAPQPRKSPAILSSAVSIPSSKTPNQNRMHAIWRHCSPRWFSARRHVIGGLSENDILLSAARGCLSSLKHRAASREVPGPKISEESPQLGPGYCSVQVQRGKVWVMMIV